jgi:glycosyltransferase involved in cell wall biosynthesis
LLKRQAAKFICVSEFMKAQAIAKGFPSGKTVVHYTGIDLRVFSADEAVSRSPVVLFVGRLVPKKGCEYLIRAMARVQEAMPEARLVVIGDGLLRREMEMQAASSLRSCEFLGEQKPEAVREWMNRAMVFGAPSVTATSGDAEGFGIVFAEAQAMGLPVVSFANGGIPEAVADEQTGFLVREKDHQALAAKILLVLGNRGLWMRMSQAGPVRAKRLFDIRTQAAGLENIYDAAISEWGGSSGVERHARLDERGGESREMAAAAGQRTESARAMALSRGK